MKKMQILMNKPVYLGLSPLNLSKILMYEFWDDHAKPKYGEKSKLRYMDTDSCIAFLKTRDIYKHIAEDFDTRFDISDYELDRPLPKGKNKKIIGLMVKNHGNIYWIKNLNLVLLNR